MHVGTSTERAPRCSISTPLSMHRFFTERQRARHRDRQTERFMKLEKKDEAPDDSWKMPHNGRAKAMQHQSVSAGSTRQR